MEQSEVGSRCDLRAWFVFPLCKCMGVGANDGFRCAWLQGKTKKDKSILVEAKAATREEGRGTKASSGVAAVAGSVSKGDKKVDRAAALADAAAAIVKMEKVALDDTCHDKGGIVDWWSPPDARKVH